MKQKIVGGLFVAALLGATALTGVTATTLPFDAKAETLLNHAPAEGFADLVETVMPAVISVEVKFATVSNLTEDEPQLRVPGLDDLPENSPFRRFFEQLPEFRGGPQMPMPRNRQQGEGSGFIISADGYAVTNDHVVKDADEVIVKTSDGKEYNADVVGTDSKTDLALLKIKGGSNFVHVKFSDKEARVGIAEAIAIEEQVRAYGGPKFQVTQNVMKNFAEAIGQAKVDIVPKVMMGGSANGQGQNGSVIETLLALLLSDKLGEAAEKTTPTRSPELDAMRNRLKDELLASKSPPPLPKAANGATLPKS